MRAFMVVSKAFVAAILLLNLQFSTASEVAPEDALVVAAPSASNEGSTAVAPAMGTPEHTAQLLKLAQDYLGFSVGPSQLAKVTKIIGDIQSSVHRHYTINANHGDSGRYSLLKRMVGKKSEQKLLSSLKKLTPSLEDGELLQQVEVIMQVLSEVSTNPTLKVEELLGKVSKVVGFDLTEGEIEEIKSQMTVMKDLFQKLIPHFLGDSERKVEEL